MKEGGGEDDFDPNVSDADEDVECEECAAEQCEEADGLVVVLVS